MHRIRKPVLILVVLAVSAGMLMPLITQWLPKRRPSVLGVETLRLILDRGEKALWRQEFEQAREAYQEALDLDPSCAPALIGRGTAYQFLGRHDLAIRDLDLLVEAGPGIRVQRLSAALQWALRPPR